MSRSFALGPGEPVATLLGLVALLNVAPRLTDAIADTAAGQVRGPEHPKLARVRALLAKAESTEFDEEAEVLSARRGASPATRWTACSRDGPAKRQQGPRRCGASGSTGPSCGPRLLVSAVASANRCRAAGAGRPGSAWWSGSSADLDAVELLVTSWLVQADAAMLRHGRRTSASGTTRTESFRQSFLPRSPSASRNDWSGPRVEGRTRCRCRSAPVLRSQEAKVAEEFLRLVPHSDQQEHEREQQRGLDGRSRGGRPGAARGRQTSRPRRVSPGGHRDAMSGPVAPHHRGRCERVLARHRGRDAGALRLRGGEQPALADPGVRQASR